MRRRSGNPFSDDRHTSVWHFVHNLSQGTLMANQDSLTVVQQAYTNFKTCDLPALVAQMGPSVEWQIPAIANSPSAGRRTGQDSVREFFTTLVTERNAITFEPRQFVAQGDTVVALGDYEWRV